MLKFSFAVTSFNHHNHPGKSVSENETISLKSHKLVRIRALCFQSLSSSMQTAGTTCYRDCPSGGVALTPPWQSCRFRKGGGAAWFPIQGGQLVLSQANLLGSPLGLVGGFCAPQRPVAVSDTPCAKELFLWPVKSKGLAILCDSGFFLRQSSVHFHLSAFPYTPAHAECLSK